MSRFVVVHEFENGWSATFDAIWVEFSRFGLTEITVNDQDLEETDMNFNDFWIFTAGLGFPITPRFEGRIGAMYLEQPVDDDDRTFSFALDEVWGVGVGVNYERANKDRIDLNLTLLNTGEAPVDTGFDGGLNAQGRVVGENDSPYAVALESPITGTSYGKRLLGQVPNHHPFGWLIKLSSFDNIET